MKFNLPPDFAEEALGAASAAITSYGLGYVHGRKGQMPALFKTTKNPNGVLPYDAAVALGGGLALLVGKGLKVLPNIAAAPIRGAMYAGEAYYFGSLGGRRGQAARKAAGELTGAPNDRTITAGGAAYGGYLPQMASGPVPVPTMPAHSFGYRRQ